MDFSSIEFFGFFAITVIVYFIVKPTRKWLVLLLASGVFLYTFSLTFLLYTLLYTLLNYILARSIYHAKNQLFKRAIYLSAISINIGLLVFFKYINFILENLFQLFGVFTDVSEPPVLTILIPLGISFYTFQTIGYIIDINRGVRKPENNIGKFLLFIIYFPKFVSGPVERANSLLPEINKIWQRDDSNIYLGINQALWGFFKKIVIADRLSVLVNTLNGDLESYTGGVLILLFFFQFLYLYCDFSGYTDIVLGISRIFGINLRENFNRPLFAKSISDFWRRTHISLTSWCNEYIFKRIMLKRMKWKKWASIYGAFITFLIIGIWHGASWNFVIFGLLQGAAISYEYLSRKAPDQNRK